jgi:hypothetical protein
MSGLNRQARLNGISPWHNYGNVTLEQAAIAMAEKLARSVDKITVQVRDEAEPTVIWTVTVESCRAWKVIGLRGGDC